MLTKRTKGYTRKSRLKRQAAERDDVVLLTGRVATAHGLYLVIDEALEKKNWNWTTLAGHVGYTRAHICHTCRSPTMSMGIYIEVMKALGLDWQKYCKLEWPKPRAR